MSSSMAWLDTAIGLLTKERYKEALELLDQSESSPTVLWRKGQAWLGIGNSARAVLLLKEAHLALTDPRNSLECAIDLASAHTRSGRWHEALDLLSAIGSEIDKTGDQRLCLMHQLGKGHAYARAGKPGAYLEIWRTVKPQLRSLNLKHEWVIGMAIAAYAHVNSGDWRSSSAVIDECMTDAYQDGFSRSVAILSYWRIICKYNASKTIDKTDIDHLLAAVAASDALDLYAHSLCVKGIHLWTKGDWQGAETSFTEAQNRYVEVDNLLDADVACISLARIAFDQGNSAIALGWIERVASRQTGPNSSHWIAGWVGLIEGWIHATLDDTDYAQAQLACGWSHFVAMPQTDLAAFCALHLAGLPSRSLADKQLWLDRATDLAGKSSVPVYQIMVDRVRGEHLLATGDAASARACLGRVLSESEAAGFHPEWVRAAAALAECDLALARTEAAWHELDQRAAGYLAACEGFPEMQAKIAFVRAKVAQACGDLPAAVAHLRSAAAQVRWMRSLAGDAALSGAIVGNFEAIYQRGAMLARALNELPLAVSFVEGRRAQWLAHRTALHQAQARARLGTHPLHTSNSDERPDRRSQAYNAFAERRRTLQAAMHDVWFGDRISTTEQRAELRDALEQQRLAYSEMNAQAMARIAIGKDGPFDLLDVANLRATFTRRFGSSWTAIQIEPASDRDNSDSWLLMALTPDNLTIETIQPDSVIESRSLQWLTNPHLDWRKQMLADQNKEAIFQRACALLKLDQWLPVDAAPEHTLIFAGCEPLTQLPLAALICADGKRLGERAVLRYAPSWNIAAHLCRTGERTNDRRTLEGFKALLVAPIIFEERHPALPASAFEIDALRSVWPDSDVLLKEQATSDALHDLNERSALMNYDLLHFATHIHFDPERSRVSGIALHDEDIWLQELLDWRLNAQLVCISGCEAGRGKDLGGEESLSIEAAFIAAGARNVISPQWHVRDKLAGAFIVEVMREYQKTADLALALANVQRRYASTHPTFDWAGWRVFGMG